MDEQKMIGNVFACMSINRTLESILTDGIRHCSTTMVDVRIVSLLLVP
jgi:hypothetical protein